MRRPGQSAGGVGSRARPRAGFGTEHLSLYQLTIEPGTRFATDARRRASWPSPIGDAAADLFEATRAMTAAAGLPAYEISNHARPGAESRHNLTYWRYGDYAGIGPGAHGRRGGPGDACATRSRRTGSPRSRATATASRSRSRSPPHDRATEALLMGLRLREGVDLARIARLAATAIAPVDRRARSRASTARA